MSSTDRQRDMRQRRRSAGLCVACGSQSPGASLCRPCRERHAEAIARYRGRDAEEARIVVQRITTPFLGRPIAAAKLRTCPHCGTRPITTIAQFGHDRLPSCSTCARDEEPHGYPTEMSIAARAILLARTCPGLTSKQIAEEMGIPAGERDAVTQALSRGSREGVVRSNGEHDLEERRYYRGKASWRITDRNGEPSRRAA